MKRVLFLVENGFEDRELMYPYYRFQEAGYKVAVVGPKAKVTYNGEYGLTLKSDFSPQDLTIDDYAAIVSDLVNTTFSPMHAHRGLLSQGTEI